MGPAAADGYRRGRTCGQHLELLCGAVYAGHQTLLPPDVAAGSRRSAAVVVAGVASRIHQRLQPVSDHRQRIEQRPHLPVAVRRMHVQATR